MKANKAPEKIYLFESPVSGTLVLEWMPKRLTKNDIEYIRTDAFIEKACEWLTDWFTDDSCKCGIPITKTARAIFF